MFQNQHVCTKLYTSNPLDRCSYSPLMAAADDSFIPDPLARYRLILWAALRLCLALLTSLGVENKEAASQVREITTMLTVTHVMALYCLLIM